MKINFISLGSGSSGNCYYLGTDAGGVLIDAGIPVRIVRKALKDVGISFDKMIHAVLVTHDHADHIKSLSTLSNKIHIPVYTTDLVHKGISCNYCMTEKISSDSRKVIAKYEPFAIGDMHITAFPVPHDGTDSVGYCIEMGGTVFAFLTDLGEITEEAGIFIQKANYLVIEANYDEEMLQMGPYPAYLKRRIQSNTGHLSNHVTAQYLAQHLPAGLRHIWLCHLSKENNHPELAYKTVELALQAQGITVGHDVQLTALRRTVPSELYELPGCASRGQILTKVGYPEVQPTLEKALSTSVGSVLE